MWSYCLAVAWMVLAGALPWWLFAGLALGGLCRGWRRQAVLAVVAALLAQLWAGESVSRALAQRISPDWPSDRDVEVHGRITGLVRRAPAAWDASTSCRHFRLHVDASSTLTAPVRLQVSVCDDSTPSLLPGDAVRMRLRVRAPWGQLNRYAGDGERWALANEIDGYATGAVLQHMPDVACGIDCLRQQLVTRVRAQLPATSLAAALLPALIAGDRSHIAPRQWQRLRELGLAHLVAISGLHIGLVAGVTWWLASTLLALLMSRSAGVLAARRWALVPALLVAFGYSALAGFSLPTQRALVMLVLVCASLAGLWSVRPAQALLAAVTLILLIQPLAVLSPGLWLSVLAVALILLLQALAAEGVWRAQWQLSWLGGLLSGWLFGDFRPAAVLANLILVPVFSLVLVPGALLGALLPGAARLLSGCAVLLEGVWALLGVLVRSPVLPASPTLPALLAVMLVLLRWGVPALPGPRWLYGLLWLPWLVPASTAPGYGEFDLVTFDVGQGQMQLVRTRTHALLYDSGPRQQSGSAVQDVLQPWLAAQRLGLDLVMHSHGDSDHTGGAVAVRESEPGALFLAGQPSRTAGHLPCRRQQQWHWDGVRIEVLWPVQGLALARDNNHSCVVLVRSAAGSLLLTGDIEREVEYWLAENSLWSSVTLVQVPHHGSRSSSSYTWLNRVRPRMATNSAGRANHFGHPATQIRSRYDEKGVLMLNSAETGMQTFRFRLAHPDGPEVELWRQRSSWPWRLPEPVIE